MQDRSTYVPAPCRFIIAVGCGGPLLANCREAAARFESSLEIADLVSLAGMAAVLRPLVVMVTADLYSFDPAEFDALVRAVGAVRLVVERNEPADQLDARLAEAIEEALACRARDAALRVPPEERRKTSGTSGIRWVAAGPSKKANSA